MQRGVQYQVRPNTSRASEDIRRSTSSFKSEPIQADSPEVVKRKESGIQETLKSQQLLKTKEILQKNMGLKKSRVSMCSNLDSKLEEVLETPLPLPPQELIFSDLGQACDEEGYRETIRGQNEKIGKLQDMCQLYYKHI